MAMSASKPAFDFDPYAQPLRWPPASAIDLDRVALSYDDATDTLYADFFGEPIPAINVPLDTGEVGFVSARLSIATREVGGLEIEGFLRYAIDRYPRWLALAEFVGPSILSADVSASPRSTPSRRRGAVATLIRQAAMLRPA